MGCFPKSGATWPPPSSPQYHAAILQRLHHDGWEGVLRVVLILLPPAPVSGV